MPEYRKIKGTPRKEALSMEDIVPMYIKAMKLGTGINIQRVFAAWDEVSGVKDFTLRKFYRDGKLYVTRLPRWCAAIWSSRRRQCFRLSMIS